MCCSVWSINSLELRDERIDFAAFLSKPLADANWAIPTGRVIEILKSLSLLLYHHVYANGLETVRVKWHIFKMLRNGLLRYILYTCPNEWCNSCSKCYGMDCFGTYLYTCPNLWCNSCFKVLRNGLLRYILYTSSNLWCNSCFKVLRNGLLRYILYTSSNLWCNWCWKCYGMDCSGTYFTHVQTCDVTRVQSATEWTASVHILHIVFQVLREWTASCTYCYGHVQTCFDEIRVHSTCSEARLDKKCDENASRYHSETKNVSKNEPHFQGPKNLDMFQVHANNNVSVTFFFLPIVIAQILKKFWNCNVTKTWKFSRFSVVHNRCSLLIQRHATTRAENSPPGCFCSLLMWPFDERLQNWVETHWFSSLRPRSIRGGRCIFKDAGETIDNGSGFYVRRFLKTWVVAWQTLNNMVIRTHTHTTRQCLPQLCWMLATYWFTHTVDRSCKVAQRRKYRTCCKLFLHGSVLNRSYSWLKTVNLFLEPFI